MGKKYTSAEAPAPTSLNLIPTRAGQIVRLRRETATASEESSRCVYSRLRDAHKGPFLIHCKHGADRTGLMSAMFRIVEQGWSKEAAIREMVNGGYGYHRVWGNIVRYIEQVDVERIRARLARKPRRVNASGS